MLIHDRMDCVLSGPSVVVLANEIQSKYWCAETEFEDNDDDDMIIADNKRRQRAWISIARGEIVRS